MDKVEYISPSLFYYWEKCPLQAVLSKQSKIKSVFPKHPDADLGTIIHKFFEKQNDWKIDSVEKFDKKWAEEIALINQKYQEDILQHNYFPIQWYSKYYAVKKNSLRNKIISKSTKEIVQPTSHIKFEYEKWISNDSIGGRIDYVISENDEIKQIVDFKTGNIFDINGNKIQLKEIYKQQLALYCAAILEKQEFIPEAIIETLDGKRVKVCLEKEYIEILSNKVKQLKNKINTAIETNTINLLSNCNFENCCNCNYRPFCEEYKTTLINNLIGKKIDIKGKITKIESNEVVIETTKSNFTLKKIIHIDKYKLNYECEIYNLYFPENEENYLYETINTVIIYAE
jgi:hypothetical protein